jgi:hypothetical protein
MRGNIGWPISLNPPLLEHGYILAASNLHGPNYGNQSSIDDMELLYDYLTSSEFTQRIQAIGDAFRSMKDDIEKEKGAMNRIWVERARQIDILYSNTVITYGGIKGILGSSMPKIGAFELKALAPSIEDPSQIEEDKRR